MIYYNLYIRVYKTPYKVHVYITLYCILCQRQNQINNYNTVDNTIHLCIVNYNIWITILYIIISFAGERPILMRVEHFGNTISFGDDNTNNYKNLYTVFPVGT